MTTEKQKEYLRKYYQKNKKLMNAQNSAWCEWNYERSREISRESYHRCKLRKRKDDLTQGGEANESRSIHDDEGYI